MGIDWWHKTFTELKELSHFNKHLLKPVSGMITTTCYTCGIHVTYLQNVTHTSATAETCSLFLRPQNFRVTLPIGFANLGFWAWRGARSWWLLHSQLNQRRVGYCLWGILSLYIALWFWHLMPGKVENQATQVWWMLFCVVSIGLLFYVNSRVTQYIQTRKTSQLSSCARSPPSHAHGSVVHDAHASVLVSSLEPWDENVNYN